MDRNRPLSHRSEVKYLDKENNVTDEVNAYKILILKFDEAGNIINATIKINNSK